MGGDFNRILETKASDRLKALSKNLRLNIQSTTGPTRTGHKSNSKLEFFLTGNGIDIESTPTVLNYTISDHFLVSLTVSIIKPKTHRLIMPNRKLADKLTDQLFNNTNNCMEWSNMLKLASISLPREIVLNPKPLKNVLFGILSSLADEANILDEIFSYWHKVIEATEQNRFSSASKGAF